MASPMLTGTAAGAVGTVALNIASYMDMTVRARPASSMPAKLAGVMAGKAGIVLASDTGDAAKEEKKNRQSGLGH